MKFFTIAALLAVTTEARGGGAARHHSHEDDDKEITLYENDTFHRTGSSKLIIRRSCSSAACPYLSARLLLELWLWVWIQSVPGVIILTMLIEYLILLKIFETWFSRE